MELKSIQNRNVVDSTNCDREPISVPGSIQPHGFILAIDSAYIVGFCSGNLPALGPAIGDILGQHIERLFGSGTTELVAYLGNGDFDDNRPYVCMLNGASWHTTVHISESYTIMELEPFPDGSLELADLYMQTKKLTAIVSKTAGLKKLCQFISGEIKKVTGYDRVMVYRFDENYNGEVFAETVDNGFEPFLGLHYPHTDIPVPARELYLRNMMRMIVDVDYVPVPIYTLNQDATYQQLDLGNSILRSVSPIHIGYLKNMGVKATLTVSLILDGRLWGLIVCHHYSPRYTPYYIRTSALLQGHFLTSQIKVQDVTLDYELKIELDNRLKEFLSQLDARGTYNEGAIASAELSAVANSNGVCIVGDGGMDAHGDVPASIEVMALVNMLASGNRDLVFSNNASRDHGIAFSNRVAGFLYFKMDTTMAVIWFKNEQAKEINWAADPNRSKLMDKGGPSPERSFASWKEMIRGYSNAWQPTEVNVANLCAYTLQKHFSLRRDRNIRDSQERLLASLKEANAELENMNWIGTHDISEPLRKIRMFASIQLERGRQGLDLPTHNLVQKISSSADRMHRLLEDLLSMSRLKDAAKGYVACDLNGLVANITLEYEDAVAEGNVSFDIGPLPMLLCEPTLMRQLLGNLVANSVRFARKGIPVVIRMKCSLVEQAGGRMYHEIHIADNGIGFDNSYNKQIFQVFQRLDSSSESDGTGIGLAICKKIIAMHGGSISADGKVDKGATFRILLPNGPHL